MSSKVSATIVAYNNYEEIMAAVESMERYTSPELSRVLYIVDNGTKVSDPARTAAFRTFLQAYDDVVYVDAGANLGFGAGHNLVMDRLDSQYHAIVNPDILFCEDAFSKIAAWMDVHPEVGMVIPDVRNEQGERQLVYRKELTVWDTFVRFFCMGLFPRRVRSHTLQDEDYSRPFRVPFGQGSFLVVRTQLFRDLQGFDDHYFMYVEDADLCRRVNEVSSLMYFPGATVIHKWNRASHRNVRLFAHHIHSLFYYFKKWGVRLF